MASEIKDRGCKSLPNAKNVELDSLKEFTSSGGKLRYVSILTVYSHYGFLGNQINESLYMLGFEEMGFFYILMNIDENSHKMSSV